MPNDAKETPQLTSLHLLEWVMANTAAGLQRRHETALEALSSSVLLLPPRSAAQYATVQ